MPHVAALLAGGTDGRDWRVGADEAAGGGVVYSDTGSSTWRENRPTLATSDDNGSNHLVAHTLRSRGADASEDGAGRGTPLVIEGDSAASTPGLPRLRAGCGRGGETAMVGASGVRRLTPRECEALQGLPPDWTRFAADGSEISDSARYRMVGNSVAVPVVEWIARRIVAQVETPRATLPAVQRGAGGSAPVS